MMIEKAYRFNQSAEKIVEKILDDDEVMINHIILNQGEAMPQHNSNSNVYMLVARGAVTLQLAEDAAKRYEHGTIVNIPGGVRMDISNTQTEQLEFFVIKAPSPRVYK